jgi:hypothetical protein
MPAVPNKIESFDVVVKDGSVDLKWTPQNDADPEITHYKLTYTNKTTGGVSNLEWENEQPHTITSLQNEHKYEFKIRAKNGEGEGPESEPVTITMNQKQPKAKTGWQHSGITYLIALIVGGANVVIIANYGLDDGLQPEMSISLVGIVTFFGVLVISAHHNHTNADDQRKHATGTMRRAMAASIILVYIITFSLTTFGDFQDKTIETSQTQIVDELANKVEQALQNNNSEAEISNIINATLTDKLPQLQGNLELELSSKTTMLGHFTTVASLVIVFYFGTKAIDNWYGKNNTINKKLWKKSLDDAVEKVPDGTAGKEDLEKLSKTLE